MSIAALYLNNFGKSAIAAVLVFLLAACSTVEDLRPTPEAQALAAESRTAMQACATAQAESHQLLHTQRNQLQLQQEQLQEQLHQAKAMLNFPMLRNGLQLASS